MTKYTRAFTYASKSRVGKNCICKVRETKYVVEINFAGDSFTGPAVVI